MKIIFSFLLFTPFLFSQSPKHEVRAAWISTASGDWPKTTDVVEQQRSLIEIFDILKNNTFNTVFFQVRPRGNTYYRSDIEPWAHHLTGTLGKDPGWDPLAFAIDEARQRGMELHAWFNVAKVWGIGDLPAHSQHIVRAHRDWVKQVEGEWWVDMGNPEAREYTENAVLELVQKYDIDGIHFDFIRYPNDKFDDWSSFSMWSDGMERGEWRRNNITSFVRNCYDQIRTEKPWVKVGSAPIGIYQSINGAQSSFAGYSGVFQDSRAWLREGIHDYVTPQLYWTIGEQKNPYDPDFTALCNDWARENYGRHVYAGIGIYRENVQPETKEQIEASRKAHTQGQAFFRFENLSAVRDQLGAVYRYPSLIPPMMWKDSVPPLAPVNIATRRDGTSANLITWNEPDAAADGEKPFRYVVYRSTQEQIDIRRAENILAVVPARRLSYRDESLQATGRRSEGCFAYFYSVTSLDRCGNESESSEQPSAEVVTLLSRYTKTFAAPLLSQNFPEPFSDKTFVSFEISQRSYVMLSLKHRETQTETLLVKETKNPGVHIVAINGALFPSGTIEYQLRVGESVVKKVMEKK